MLEHSCAPNAHFATTGQHLEVYAIAPIAKGEESEQGLFRSTAARRFHPAGLVQVC
jgi:hypothetical protein